jgi:acyl-coenzyme A thioesterase 13
MQVGRTMALIRGIMCSPDGKTTYATCEHHKVAVPTLPAHLKYPVPWDEQWAGKGKDAKL